MKACNVAKLIVIMGCVTLTPNVYAQAASAMPMASSPAAGSGKAAPTDKQLARDVRKALSKAPNFNVSNVFVKARGGVVITIRQRAGRSSDPAGRGCCDGRAGCNVGE